MNIYQRATQLWALLVFAATNRQVLSYHLVSQLVGAPEAAIGGFLAPIQSYCMGNNLPPLTVLVVNETTGFPGAGFIAAQDIPRAQVQVFGHEWLAQRAPSPEQLQQAHTEQR